ANRRLHSQAPLCERLSPVLNGLQNLTQLHDIELRVYDLEDEDIQSTLHLDIPEDYQARLKASPETDSVPMLRMEFTGQSVDAPL
ncbi:hypothetical protein MJN51_39445, partial [Salmonella enterica subsp. enterica serovar Kentucky]|nr:hypothetical protein [Salmonella enterica subsp. enterica serovar Kentucky]